ncbi:lipoprotein [Accumulibacter sp.]|uniref:LPS translocon maturation chaperone LptM n=1 Tax=Accumulibacter sp. TaxID=2053492 RepID=UPI002BB85CBA|nr:lipoprotein [Accumulibacter sp.]HPU81135.1 lipoprotein [Accumulibacter sp.]
MRQHLVLALLASLTLGACGTKGSLTLPPVPTTPPAPVAATAPPLPATATATATATAPDAGSAKNSNTPGEPAR